MQHAAQQRFVELLRSEPDVYISQERAEQLARQAGYADWPGFARPGPPFAEPASSMRVVTNAHQLERVGESTVPARPASATRRAVKSRAG